MSEIVLGIPCNIGDKLITEGMIKELKQELSETFIIKKFKKFDIEYKIVNNTDLYRLAIVFRSDEGTIISYDTRWVVGTYDNLAYTKLIVDLKMKFNNMVRTKKPYKSTKGVSLMGKPRCKRKWIIGKRK